MKHQRFFIIGLSAVVFSACMQNMVSGPRPVDTTDPAIFSGDGATLYYCDLTVLDDSGLNSYDIPKAYTPEGLYQTFPLPILADCTEPLAADAADIRGLWVSEDGAHLERIEQCGNRVVITSAGIIHDMRTDGTLDNGANDISPSGDRIRASAQWNNGVLALTPWDVSTLVTRELVDDQLTWEHPSAGTVITDRACYFP